MGRNCVRGLMTETNLFLGCPFIRFNLRNGTFRSFRRLCWCLDRFGWSCLLRRFRHRRGLTWTTRAQTVSERLSFRANDHFFLRWCVIWLTLDEAVWPWRHLRSTFMPVTRRSRSAMLYRILWMRVVWASGRWCSPFWLLWTSFHVLDRIRVIIYD